MILVELDTDHSCAIKYNKSMIEIVNPLPVTIFRCHFKLLQEVTALKTPKKLIINFFLQSRTNGCKKINEIKRNRFFMECFTADFVRVFNKSVKIWPLDVRLGTCHQMQAFHGFS